MLVCCIAYHMHIVYTCVPKLFPTLTINGNNCFCCNIIVYNLDHVINVLILQTPI